MVVTGALIFIDQTKMLPGRCPGSFIFFGKGNKGSGIATAS
jgi:hypothetical protein